MLVAVINGLLLSMSLILPLGIQNLFVFQQGASGSTYLRALPVIITAGLCDTILISIAVTGVSVIAFSNHWVKVMIMIIGILFLMYMGWQTWRSNATVHSDQRRDLTLKKQISFAASVSLLNPHAILDTIGVIGTSSLHYSGYDRLFFAIASIAVSWIWFFGLALAGRLFGRIDPSGRLMLYFNKISAVLMWLIAISLLRSIIYFH